MGEFIVKFAVCDLRQPFYPVPMTQPQLSQLNERLDEVIARLVTLDVEQSWIRAELAALRELTLQARVDSTAPLSQLEKWHAEFVAARFEELRRSVEAQLPSVAADGRKHRPGGSI